MNNDVTLLIDKWKSGCKQSERTLKAEIFLHLKGRLKKHKAQLRSNGEAEDLLPNTTSFINEYFIDFAPPTRDYENRKQYLKDVSIFIRNALISELRKRKAIKRGNLFTHTSLSEFHRLNIPEDDEQYSVFDEAITLLKSRSEQCYEVALFYYFLGMTGEEIAKEFAIPTGKIYRHIDLANAFLRSKFTDAP
ncbi:ECF-type sigma factor [Pseudoalteromonas luteoviolacea]|uniref:RNA polymerase sigma-70 ECF-like HTH domain-containing protein n=1 Tax=Pseudoalteromonas luteoviolacea S4060-1 TaxID=1365257 RepID=A0A162CLA2_9GAMM|nr:ECF-type sigma factor [Pseudoalteromonas luteoviolacea]KZN70353.1 hypothetical protein N478_00185 [Pseudoalteromonas luteoviolacea S4060-1]